MNTRVQVVCGHVFSILLGVLLGVEFLGPLVAACFYFWGVTKLFPGFGNKDLPFFKCTVQWHQYSHTDVNLTTILFQNFHQSLERKLTP